MKKKSLERHLEENHHMDRENLTHILAQHELESVIISAKEGRQGALFGRLEIGLLILDISNLMLYSCSGR